MAAQGAAAAAWQVGDRVQAVYEDGNWYYAAVEEANHEEDVYLVAYEGCDLREYVYGASVRAAEAEEPGAAVSASQSSSSAASLPEQAKRRGTIRRLTLSPQMREVVKLLESENEFTQKLEVLERFFAEPTRKTMSLPPKQRMLDEETFEALFSQIEPIAQLSRRLLADLEQRFDAFEGGDGAPAVGDIFSSYAPFFKLYSAYIAHHEGKVQPALKRLPSKFRSYVKNCSKAPEVGATLDELLALPTARINAYISLLGDVLKVTPQRERDHAQLEKAVRELNEAAASVRSALSSRRNQDVIVSIEKKFIGSPGFSKPGRYIIREGGLCKKPRDLSQGDRDYRFYLFNDMLAYASSIGWKMKLHGKVDINFSFHVRALPREGSEHRLLVCTSAKSFVVYAGDEKSRDDWLRAIEGAIAEVRKSIPEQQRKVPPPVAPLPIWLRRETVPRLGEIYPSTGSLAGMKGPDQPVGRGKEARGPTRDAVADVLNPTVRTIDREGMAPRQVELGQAAPAPRRAAPAPAPAPAPRSVFAQRQQQMNQRRPPPAVPTRPASGGDGGGGGPRFCTQCGNKRTSDTAKFCDKCGTKF